MTDFDYKKVRNAAENAASQLTTADWRKLRRLCKTNLFFLGYTILGFKKLSADLHGELCAWTDNSQNERFRGILYPRGHYKSSIWSIAHTIQSFLPDDVGDQPWPYCLGTDIRIVIGHEVAAVASRFLVTITQHIQSNENLIKLFPEIIPDPDKQRVNKSELELPRTMIMPEPTVDTMGTGARAQSKHFNLIKLDDIIGDKSVDSKLEMDAAKEWVDNIPAFFSSFTEDHLMVSGTHYAPKDAYHHIQDVYGAAMKWKIKGFWKKDSAGVHVKDEKGEKVPIFPEQFNALSIAQIQKNRRIWTAQFLNDPKDGDGEFQPDWLRYFYWIDVKERRLLYETAPEIKQEHTAQDLDICFLIDPAVSGETGFVVTGMNARGQVFTLEAVKKAWKPPEFVDFLFQRVLYWRPRIVGVESVNFSALYEPWLRREMSVRRTYFRVEPLKTQNKAKGARILGLGSYWANGQIFINISQVDLKEEFEDFNPLNCDLSHLLDALAHGPQIWKPYSGLRIDPERNSQVHRDILSRRDPITGYTPVAYISGDS